VFSLFDLAAILLTLSAFLGWLNHKFIPLPHTIGLLVMSVVTSVLSVGFDLAFPAQHIFEPLTAALLQIDFSSVVMNGMLAFLLFAGALQVDLGKLRNRAIPVAVLAGRRDRDLHRGSRSRHLGSGPAYRPSHHLRLGAGVRGAHQSNRPRRRSQRPEERQCAG
jgi:hypothetical protein